MQLRVGDKVMLRKDAVKRFLKRIPSREKLMREQFEWKTTLSKLMGKVGVVERVFPNSKHVNVRFGNELIGIDSTELVRVDYVGKDTVNPFHLDTVKTFMRLHKNVFSKSRRIKFLVVEPSLIILRETDIIPDGEKHVSWWGFTPEKRAVVSGDITNDEAIWALEKLLS